MDRSKIVTLINNLVKEGKVSNFFKAAMGDTSNMGKKWDGKYGKFLTNPKKPKEIASKDVSSKNKG